MDVTRKQNKSGLSLRISGEATIYEAANLHAQLLNDNAGFNKTVQLNLEQVSELDTAGVQLLLMLQREISQLGGTLKLQASNEYVDQVLNVFHLPPPFQRQENAS